MFRRIAGRGWLQLSHGFCIAAKSFEQPRRVSSQERAIYARRPSFFPRSIIFSALRKKEGTLKLLNLTRRNVELLVLTKLETVFEVFDDEQSAVNSFFPNREIKHFDILAFLQQRKKGAGGK